MKLQPGSLKGQGADEATVWKAERTGLLMKLQSGRLNEHATDSSATVWKAERTDC